MEDMLTLGVIGTGHLATYVITALRRGGFDGRILLTPRNADRAAVLERDAACEIAPSSREVMAGADIVLLSVRPQHAQAALEGLTWSTHQTALSVMAGVRLETVRQMVPGAGCVHLMMPLSYIATVRGPIPLYPPAPHLMEFLGGRRRRGCPGQREGLRRRAARRCASAWIYDLADALAVELARHGLDPQAARALALGNIVGPAGDALSRPAERLSALSASIATEGTYTKLGLDLLRERGFDAPWREAIGVIAAKLG
jgi:pyrroline-5-carboxylate reductase